MILQREKESTVSKKPRGTGPINPLTHNVVIPQCTDPSPKNQCTDDFDVYVGENALAYYV